MCSTFIESEAIETRETRRLSSQRGASSWQPRRKCKRNKAGCVTNRKGKETFAQEAAGKATFTAICWHLAGEAAAAEPRMTADCISVASVLEGKNSAVLPPPASTISSTYNQN